MSKDGRLAGAVAVVTGAGAGIGEAIVKTFAREGARVAIVSRNVVEAQRVGREVAAAGGAALVIPADATRAADVDAMVRTVLDRWDTIDILVNGVGGWQRLAPITDIAEDDWDRTIQLNLKSAFLCTRAVARVMMQKKKGCILNFASQSGTGPNGITDSNLAYAAAKAGVIVLGKHLAKQLGPHGIRVNTISPGTLLAPRTRGAADDAAMERRAAANPLRCFVDEQDSANAALFLASDESRHITGVTLNVNAGAAIV